MSYYFLNSLYVEIGRSIHYVHFLKKTIGFFFGSYNTKKFLLVFLWLTVYNVSFLTPKNFFFEFFSFFKKFRKELDNRWRKMESQLRNKEVILLKSKILLILHFI